MRYLRAVREGECVLCVDAKIANGPPDFSCGRAGSARAQVMSLRLCAGNIKTSAFIPFWRPDMDSFAMNQPNSDFSIIEGEAMRQVVVVLQDPTERQRLALQGQGTAG
jgi:hypothetical protein